MEPDIGFAWWETLVISSQVTKYEFKMQCRNEKIFLVFGSFNRHYTESVMKLNEYRILSYIAHAITETDYNNYLFSETPYKWQTIDMYATYLKFRKDVMQATLSPKARPVSRELMSVFINL